MATWRARFSSVEDWFIELLPQMGFSKGLAKSLINEKRLLPLFDGLDELAEENRKDCLEAIGEFGRDQHIEYVICSRIAEYAETVDAPVYCQIKVKPLTVKQIKSGLRAADSPETKGILHAIEQDSLLAEAIQTPFYLNTIQLLFASMKSWEEFGFSGDTLEGRKQEIVDTFIEESAAGFVKSTSEQVKKWLGFLADRMNKNELVNFELVNFQYDWGSFSGVQFLGVRILGIVVCNLLFGIAGGLIYSLVAGLFCGLIVGLVFSLIASLFLGLKAGLMSGLTVGLITCLGIGMIGLLVSMIGSLSQSQIKIETKDITNWTLSKMKKNSIEFLKMSLTVGLIFGFILGIVIGIELGQEEGFVVGIVENFGWSLLIGLGGGLVLGSILSLIIVIPKSLIDQLANTQSYLQVTTPYQRFNASMWRLHFSILQHFHLRRLLSRKGLLPKRLVRFLQEATENYILESDGGSWRFRHRILQDYFAQHWQEVYAEKEDKNLSTKK